VSIRDIVSKLSTRILLPLTKDEFQQLGITGPDIALNKPVKISGIVGNAAIYPGERAVDGNEETRWSGAPGGDKCWIYVDLLDTYRFDALTIKFEVALGKEFFLDKAVVVDGKLDWTPFMECRGVEGWNYYDLRELGESGRYLRVHLKMGREVGWGMSIYILRLQGEKL